MGREVGGGIGMGKTCEPKAFSFQCMAKFTTNKKKRKEKIKIKKNKKRKEIILTELMKPYSHHGINLWYSDVSKGARLGFSGGAVV